MNTVKSLWIGWASLGLAGGGAYYFAKKSINADRSARYKEEDMKRRSILAQLEEQEFARNSHTNNGGPPVTDSAHSPSRESTLDPAPTQHAPDTEGQRVREKSKYESSEPFRSKKGDRFS